MPKAKYPYRLEVSSMRVGEVGLITTATDVPAGLVITNRAVASAFPVPVGSHVTDFTPTVDGPHTAELVGGKGRVLVSETWEVAS